MAKIGYARVSTRSQNDDSQIDELTVYGCDKIFTDKASGKLADRPELDKAPGPRHLRPYSRRPGRRGGEGAGRRRIRARG
jgi:hypothetical protein